MKRTHPLQRLQTPSNRTIALSSAASRSRIWALSTPLREHDRGRDATLGSSPGPTPPEGLFRQPTDMSFEAYQLGAAARRARKPLSSPPRADGQRAALAGDRREQSSTGSEQQARSLRLAERAQRHSHIFHLLEQASCKPQTSGTGEPDGSAPPFRCAKHPFEKLRPDREGESSVDKASERPPLPPPGRIEPRALVGSLTPISGEREEAFDVVQAHVRRFVEKVLGQSDRGATVDVDVGHTRAASGRIRDRSGLDDGNDELCLPF